MFYLFAFRFLKPVWRNRHWHRITYISVHILLLRTILTSLVVRVWYAYLKCHGLFLFPDCHSIFGHGENRNEADYVCGNELINKQCVYLSTYAYMHWILLLVSVMGKRMKNLNSECAMIDVHESKFCHIRSAPNIYKIFLVYQNKIGII